MAEFDPRFPTLMEFGCVLPLIENASLLQYRSRSLVSSLIRLGSLGCHSHSAMVRRNGDDRIDVLEMREWIGGRAQPLEGQVEQFPGLIDVFRPRRDKWPEFNPIGAVKYMRDLTCRKYGFSGILRVASMRIVGFRLYWAFRGFPYDDAAGNHLNPFCSHAVCSAYRIGGGVDPVPRKPDYLVTPNDLTNSMLFEYQFTLSK